MGNHEYCEDCGVNSFHRGQPCDPKKLAARIASRELAAKRRNLSVEKTKKALDAAGFKVSLFADGYGGVIPVQLLDVEDDEL